MLGEEEDTLIQGFVVTDESGLEHRSSCRSVLRETWLCSFTVCDFGQIV